MNRFAVVGVTFVVTLALVLGAAAVVGMVLDHGEPTPPAIENEQYDADLLVPDNTPGEANVEPSADEDPNRVLIHADRGIGDRDIRPLTNALVEAGHDVSVAEPTPNELDAADAVVIVGEPGLTGQQADDIEDFVENDGRLAILLDAFGEYRVGPERAALDSAIDLTVEPGYVYNMEDKDFDHLRTFSEPDATDAVTEGVDRVMFQTATPVRLGDGDAMFRPTEGTQLSTTRAPTDLPIVSRDDGVLAVGDYTFLEPENAQRVDNDVFIANLADFLVEGDRETVDPDDENGEGDVDGDAEEAMIRTVETHYAALDAADADALSATVHPDAPMDPPTQQELDEIAEFEISFLDPTVTEYDDQAGFVEGTEHVVLPDGDAFEEPMVVELRPHDGDWLVWEYQTP